MQEEEYRAPAATVTEKTCSSSFTSETSFLTDIDIEDIMSHDFAPHFAEMCILNTYVEKDIHENTNFQKEIQKNLEEALTSANFTEKKYFAHVSCIYLLHLLKKDNPKKPDPSPELIDSIMFLFLAAVKSNFPNATPTCTC